jgi:hypothetical protein
LHVSYDELDRFGRAIRAGGNRIFPADPTVCTRAKRETLQVFGRLGEAGVADG